MHKDVIPGHEMLPDNKKRRVLLKTGVGLATAFSIGGKDIWTLFHAPQQAHAAALNAPTIIGCDSWGARQPSSPVTVLNIKSKEIIIHHTEFPNSTDYSLQHAYDLSRQIQNLHMDTNGWIDTGQHFTVTRGGYVLEGRHRSLEVLQAGNGHVQSAHCPGMNSEAIGIENEGTYFTETPPDVLLNSLQSLCVYICQQYGLNANNIFGHWDFADTDCPGRTFYAMFPTLRKNIAVQLGQIAAIPTRTWPDHRSGTAGVVVQTIQNLLTANGYTVKVDGSFATKTDTQVRKFQGDHAIPVDGHVNNLTWEALVIPVQQGSSGKAVTALQILLQRNGYTVTATGSFDAATKNAVQSLQQLHGLTTNGAVDLNTWCVAVGGNLGSEFR